MAPDLRLIISYVMKTHAAQPSASVSRAVAINITSARQPRCHCRCGQQLPKYKANSNQIWPAWYRDSNKLYDLGA